MRHGKVSDPDAWFALARTNLEQAGIAMQSDRPEWALEQLQQAAEKAMKGALVRAGIRPRRIHDLAGLSEEIEKLGVDLQWFRPTADALGIEYMASRYPGFPEDAPDEAEARRMMEETRRLLAQLTSNP